MTPRDHTHGGAFAELRQTQAHEAMRHDPTHDADFTAQALTESAQAVLAAADRGATQAYQTQRLVGAAKGLLREYEDLSDERILEWPFTTTGSHLLALRNAVRAIEGDAP